MVAARRGVLHSPCRIVNRRRWLALWRPPGGEVTTIRRRGPWNALVIGVGWNFIVCPRTPHHSWPSKCPPCRNVKDTQLYSLYLWSQVPRISVSQVLQSAGDTVLGLIAAILRDCTVDEHVIAECVLRLPI